MDTANLKTKGWTDEEVHHLMKALREAEARKHPTIKILDQSIYWIFLVLAVLGNIAFSFTLIPIIIVMPGALLYTLTAFTGLMFGTLCTTILKSIDTIDTKHHLIYITFIPIAGFLNFLLIVRQANQAVGAFGLGGGHGFILLGITYLAAFFLPYTIFYRKGDIAWT